MQHYTNRSKNTGKERSRSIKECLSLLITDYDYKTIIFLISTHTFSLILIITIIIIFFSGFFEMREILLVIFCIFVGCFGLSCFYCDKNFCPELAREKCAHGVVKDVCGCCDVCAQGEGEVCGGIYYDHTCSAGTKCIIELEFGLPYHTYIHMNGTCKSEKQGTSQFTVVQATCFH